MQNLRQLRRSLWNSLLRQQLKLLSQRPRLNKPNVKMIKKQAYKVAGHVFILEMDACSAIWEKSKESYSPFEISASSDDEVLFTIRLHDRCDKLQTMELVYSNAQDVEPGYVLHDIYRGPEGHYFEFTQPGSDCVNGKLRISDNLKTAEMSLHGTGIEQWLTFTVCMNFCFLLASSSQMTLFFHASCVKYKGKAYLFLGKSGTGKSTHSRMWQEALDDVLLMNDDHPVLRIGEDGTVTAYGSPWSGKTRCYKSVSAPVGGVIRISRAPYNKARRLSMVEAYASIMTSCSGITWERKMADDRDRTMQGIIGRVPCWVMECLPDNEAARVCSAAVVEEC